MAKKSCLRRLCKYLPISVAAQRAVTLDEMAEAGLGQNLAALVENPQAALPEPVVNGETRQIEQSESTIAAKFHKAALEKLALAEDAGMESGAMIAQLQRLKAQWMADHANDKAAIAAIETVAAKELEKLGANE